MTPPESTAIIGLGKVGLPIAAALASRGVRVSGFDLDPARRALLETRDTANPEIADEQGLAEILARPDLDLRVSASLAETLEGATIAFVIVPTPSAPDGHFDLAMAEQAIRAITEAAVPGGLPLLVVLVSTVSPGSVQDTLLPLVEAANRNGPPRFSFCYSPALIALDNVVAGFLQPDFAFVGETDRPGADRLERFYRQVLGEALPIHRMSAQSVEIAKIALNNFLTLKISFANLVGHLCNATPDADAGAVLAALGQDSRIGTRFLASGPGFGGPCLPRDNAAFSAALRARALPTELPQAALSLNRAHAALLIDRLGLAPGGKVGIVGLGYKPASRVTIDSFAVLLANALAHAGQTVYAFDARSAEMDLSGLNPAITVADPAGAEAQDCDLLLLTAPTAYAEALVAAAGARPRIALVGADSARGRPS